MVSPGTRPSSQALPAGWCSDQTIEQRVLGLDAAGEQDAAAGHRAVDRIPERAVTIAAHRVVAAGAEQERIGDRDRARDEHLAGFEARVEEPPAERAIAVEARV